MIAGSLILVSSFIIMYILRPRIRQVHFIANHWWAQYPFPGSILMVGNHLNVAVLQNWRGRPWIEDILFLLKRLLNLLSINTCHLRFVTTRNPALKFALEVSGPKKLEEELKSTQKVAKVFNKRMKSHGPSNGNMLSISTDPDKVTGLPIWAVRRILSLPTAVEKSWCDHQENHRFFWLHVSRIELLTLISFATLEMDAVFQVSTKLGSEENLSCMSFLERTY